jgi:toxin ParE1/3/4
MARVRVAGPAQTDLASILAASAERWGDRGRARYARLLAGAMRLVATAPDGPTTRDRSDLLEGIRSLHLRHVPGKHGVSKPVHVLYYRVAGPDVVEIVRVLHQRMEPSRHVIPPTAPRSRRRSRRRK